ncbi:M6 family metalloprotease domain-containing protein [Mucilaginibacter sp. P25]|uniref:M6 family metalloprotease domain-containing protein n=1 Tax=Mucilaginibacter sp. P25 TaxID=3423945 RepID=UPI003D79269F
MPAPFYAQQFTFRQPDGSLLQVRGWGDQHYAHFETLDGYTVIRDPKTRFYHYAVISNGVLTPSGIQAGKADPGALTITKGLRNIPGAVRSLALLSPGLPPGRQRWKQRWEAEKARRLFKGLQPAPPAHPTTGTYVGLCLLIQFPDVAGTIIKKDVSDFCNQKVYKGYGNNGSVHDYYLENSGGKLQYTNIVSDYYTAKNPRDYYTDESFEQPLRAVELITEALESLNNNGFDFSDLSADDQEYVYAINVFYAGEVVNNWSQGLWPHSFHLTAAVPLGPGRNAYDYQISNMGTQLSLGTFCHENGHMVCNFPDLYDYGQDSAGIGEYCLMCGGGNADKFNPVNISAYLKYKAGWAASLTPLTQQNAVPIKAGMNDFYIAKKTETEYFLMENRQQSGRDKALPAAGLAIWHIDEAGNQENQQMTEAQHYECSLIQADGHHDLEHNANQGDQTDLFHASGFSTFTPGGNPPATWWDGAGSGLSITGIGPAAPIMHFSAQFNPIV